MNSPLLGLAVDDTRSSREVMSQSLILAGCDSITTLDGYAGWLLVESLIPSIVVTDLDMPGWGGLQLIEAMRHSNNPSVRAIPVIVCSSTTQASSIRAALDAGGDRFLAKPIKTRVLREVVIQLLGERVKQVGDHCDAADVGSDASAVGDTSADSAVGDTQAG